MALIIISSNDKQRIVTRIKQHEFVVQNFSRFSTSDLHVANDQQIFPSCRIYLIHTYIIHIYNLVPSIVGPIHVTYMYHT